MTVSVLAAAKRLCAKSGWTLTNLEAQKIIYIAHMFYMGRNDGLPLVDGHFEAWDYGPVHPSLYRRVKMFGRSSVQDVFHDVDDMLDGPEAEILDEAYSSLGHLKAGQLVNATHRPNGAWQAVYKPGVMGIVIPNQAILSEYQALNGV